MQKLKTIQKNGYPTKFVDKCIAKFLKNILIQKLDVTAISKLELRIASQYLGNISNITKRRLNRYIGKRFIPETLQSNFICKFK